MKIAIAGYGNEGKASYAYWNTPVHEVTIVDERNDLDDLPEGVTTLLGEGVFSNLDGFDLVIRTAGLAPRAISTNGKIWSATNEFFAKCPAPIIGITGTKGKGTTASLVASILRAAGKTVHLVGNIGVPALSALPNVHSSDIVVYELSSFQLWDIEKSPHVAVVLGIEPDHLDIHADFDDYFHAKCNIVTQQNDSDVIVFNKNNEYSKKIAAQSSANTVLPYPFDISAVQDYLKIPGKHNIENASAAIAAVREFVQDETIIRQGLAAFDGLPHRLKLVRQVNGVKYFDDSIATTPGSAIAALHAFNESKTIILGGSDKGADYADLIQLCKATSTRVIALGQLATKIKTICAEMDVFCEVVQRMSDAVDAAASVAKRGSIVILSPAAASFDMFVNYADRGDQFIAAVQQLETT